MQVTQLLDPFAIKASGSKSHIWLILIIVLLVAGTLFYFYRQNKIDSINTGFYSKNKTKNEQKTN